MDPFNTEESPSDLGKSRAMTESPAKIFDTMGAKIFDKNGRTNI